MAEIYNSSLSKEIIEGGKLQLSRDRIPTQLAEKVVPVMEVNPKLLRRIDFISQGTKSGNGSGIVFTSDSKKRTFITNLIWSFVSDAVCENTFFGINFAIKGGILADRIVIPKLTLTSINNCIPLNFNFPLEIEPGSAIYLTNDTATLGTAISRLTIMGYTENLD
jgi:hypothetical protein